VSYTLQTLISLCKIVIYHCHSTVLAVTYFVFACTLLLLSLRLRFSSDADIVRLTNARIIIIIIIITDNTVLRFC